MAEDLRTFVARLEGAGELCRVSAEVSTELEIAEIASRLVAEGGPAALFENVRGSADLGQATGASMMPVLVGAFASMKRMAWALGAESIEDVAKRVGELVQPPLAGGFLSKIKAAPKLLKLAGLAPKTVRSGPCQEVVRTGEEADLGHLPILKCWPRDGGPYVTLGQVYTTAPPNDEARRHEGTKAQRGRAPAAEGASARAPTHTPHAATRNCGMYRLQVHGPRRLGMHFHRDHDGARNHRAWAERGEAMPVAVALGGDPVLTYAATAPLPYGLDELVFAGFLRGSAVRVVPCRTVPLEVPAGAEIVIEGTIAPDERETEGPFGDHTGYYTPPDEYPVMRVTAITHRADAVYPTTVVGRFPKEDLYLAKTTERLFLPVIRTFVPEVVDLDLPLFGTFHNWAFVSIRKTHPHQGRKVMHALWGLGQMMYTKYLVVVDADVNVHDAEEVLWRVGAEADPRRDTVLTTGPADVLDHAAPQDAAAGKLGIDATRKLPEEVGGAAWPEPLESDPETGERVARRWAEYGFE
jgi:4-hydroxy-3-polyprenylbenzoate decarboxylase